eukprot:CAMPEP_0203755840 /NCGR_PEP_ID=MMETSP0098-20131031/9186_1 /ASSEMBLY_ACC=CAM_ASM_000208 /TAXON_ID=96639 /ORGANISM=" , Strain NY0313808BC1" /LENGTH=514 /DNA_ID=CAMNT_0050647445 /DNA_START=252 /DNA_END=1796 /DNA_ORIENTATION=+
MAAAAFMADAELLMVQTLTRHGERAPDKIIAQQSCTAVWNKPKKIYKDFHALPGRLTPIGVQRMRDVGGFIRERYIDGFHWDPNFEKPEPFLKSSYQLHQGDWDFVAREGYRQQRSMSAISLGIFPNEPVPIKVKQRRDDSALGGPAPSCGEATAKMIVDWYKSKGWAYVKQHMDDVVKPIEKMCNVSLEGLPVNAKPGGPNPHSWLGDCSDALDSAVSCDVKLPKMFNSDLHKKLTDVGFYIQEGSHYEDPKGATMFAGSFPETLLKSFEAWENTPKGKTPKKTPRARLFSCSRELLYGLEHMFGWEVKIPNQPPGRVTSGTTFIWELHRVKDILDPSKTGLVVKSYWWRPGQDRVQHLQEDVALTTLRKKYESYIKKTGKWQDICDYKHFNPAHNLHDPNFINPDAVSSEEEMKLESEANGNGKKEDNKAEAPETKPVPKKPTETKHVPEKATNSASVISPAGQDQVASAKSSSWFPSVFQFIFLAGLLVALFLLLPRLKPMFSRSAGYEQI